MPITQPITITPADITEAVRRILESHIRMMDGRCRGCYVEYNRTAMHPCVPFDWATTIQAHELTVRFLST
jgi:hypothetical protein